MCAVCGWTVKATKCNHYSCTFANFRRLKDCSAAGTTATTHTFRAFSTDHSATSSTLLGRGTPLSANYGTVPGTLARPNVSPGSRCGRKNRDRITTRGKGGCAYSHWLSLDKSDCSGVFSRAMRFSLLLRVRTSVLTFSSFFARDFGGHSTRFAFCAS